MENQKEIYCSYLLRIWIEPTDGDSWRFSLEDTKTGKRVGFASMRKLVDYLDHLMDTECEPEIDQ